MIPAYLTYLQAYYHQLSRQVPAPCPVLAVSPGEAAFLERPHRVCDPQNCFKPVETLQELEKLTSEVLLPMLSHHAVRDLVKNLK